MKKIIITSFILAVSGSALAADLDSQEYRGDAYLAIGDSHVSQVGTIFRGNQSFSTELDADEYRGVEYLAMGEVDIDRSGSTISEPPAVGSSNAGDPWADVFPGGHIEQ